MFSLQDRLALAECDLFSQKPLVLRVGDRTGKFNSLVWDLVASVTSLFGKYPHARAPFWSLARLPYSVLESRERMREFRGPQ